MFNPLSIIEKAIYIIRNFFWNLPDLFFSAEKNSFQIVFFKVYKASVPLSHFLLALFFVCLIVAVPITGLDRIIAQSKSAVLIEGVVMGSDVNLKPQKISKIDPLRPSNIQLEKDLIELIYEPLIRYKIKESGNNEKIELFIEEVLADEVIKIRTGADYQFNLKKNVSWHDGFSFSADDVIRTFEVISRLEGENAYINAVKQLRWEKIDDFTVRVCTKGSLEDSTCNNTKDNPIFSNFLELISVKIIPKHRTEDIDLNNIVRSIPELFTNPVGTGKYKFRNANETIIEVEKNNSYYNISEIPRIDVLRFKYYRNIEEAIMAMKNGEVHSLVSTTTQGIKEISVRANINSYLSPVLDTQYWAMYFNLRKDNDNRPIGPKFFQDVNVRRAISSAINREEILQVALLGMGVEAYGPISYRSAFFNQNANWYRYNLIRANDILNQTEWKFRTGSKYRTNNNGEEMKFSLYFVESVDRRNVATIIKENLEKVGINVLIDRSEQQGKFIDSEEGWSFEELNNQILAPRSFDAILYGMNTFFDPDRYELFHSSQSSHPKLNISSYVGIEETVKPRENRKEGESSLVRVPRVDRLLELTKSLDPEEARSERLENYLKIQELIAEDCPVVFLYHPQYVYYVNNKVKNVDISGAFGLEDRFKKVFTWELSV